MRPLRSHSYWWLIGMSALAGCGAVAETGRPESDANTRGVDAGGSSDGRSATDAVVETNAPRDIGWAIDAQGQDTGDARPAACPATLPSNLLPCSVPASAVCVYPVDVTCTCAGQPVAEWACSAACPASQPRAGDPCSDIPEPCSYGGITCECALSDGQSVFFCD